jgi:hypothetical protein
LETLQVELLVVNTTESPEVLRARDAIENGASEIDLFKLTKESKVRVWSISTRVSSPGVEIIELATCNVAGVNVIS